MRTFLVPARKVPKESGIGEALTVKPIGAAFCNHHCTPSSSHPPLCTSPGPQRENCCSRLHEAAISNRITACYSKDLSRNVRFWMHFPARRWGLLQNRQRTSFRRGPGGGLGGGRLKTGVERAKNRGSNERFCGQRLPTAAFFGSFLVRTQEMNTLQVFEQSEEFGIFQFSELFIVGFRAALGVQLNMSAFFA